MRLKELHVSKRSANKNYIKITEDMINVNNLMTIEC